MVSRELFAATKSVKVGLTWARLRPSEVIELNQTEGYSVEHDGLCTTVRKLYYSRRCCVLMNILLP